MKNAVGDHDWDTMIGTILRVKFKDKDYKTKSQWRKRS